MVLQAPKYACNWLSNTETKDHYLCYPEYDWHFSSI